MRNGLIDIDTNLFSKEMSDYPDDKIIPLPILSSMRNNTQCYTLANRTYKIWNSIPVSIKQSSTILAFKRRLSEHNLSGKYSSLSRI
jgi:hypothetical protein